jgi:hypothetical protein
VGSNVTEELSYLGFPKILLAVEVHYEHVRRLHEFLLHATGRNVDLVFMANASSSTSTCHLANSHVSHGFYHFLFITPRPPGG